MVSVGKKNIDWACWLWTFQQLYKWKNGKAPWPCYPYINTRCIYGSYSLKSHIVGYCYVDIILNENVYPSCHLGILKDLCSDIICGQGLKEKHESVIIKYGGFKPELIIPVLTPVCALSAAQLEEPSLFANLHPDCKPIATKTKISYSKRLINFYWRKSLSLPWGAQVVVVRFINKHKKRLCLDYSQTINQYTELDAHPLPRIDDMVNNLAGYKVFSTLDLKSAYHQVPIKEADRKYTAFEAKWKTLSLPTHSFWGYKWCSCFPKGNG